MVVTDPPVNATVPVVSGSGFAVGTAVSTTDGTWTGGTPQTYAYQWQQCTSSSDTSTCADISGAVADSFTPTVDQAGKFLRAGVAATNADGTATAYSALSASQEIVTTPVFTADSPSELAEKDFAYSYTFQVSGGRVTYSLSWDAGRDPGGLTLNSSSGVLSGSPAAMGDYAYTVTATNDAGSTTSALHALSISDGTPFAISISQQPVGGASGDVLDTQPIVRLEDEDGRVILTPTAITATSSTGSTLGGTNNPVTTVNGVAEYTNLTLAGLVDTDYTLAFTAGAISATSSAVLVTPGAVASLQIDTEPVAAAAAGDPLVTQPVLTVLDAQRNLVDDRSTTIVTTSVLSSSTSATGGAVTGSQAAGLATTTGVATFTNLAFGGTVGTLYKLKFTAGAVSVLSQDVSNSQAGPAAKLSISVQPTLNGTQLVGTDFATQPVVDVLDAGDNLTTSTATVTATASGGSLGGTSEKAAVSGTSSFTDLTFAGLIGTNYDLTFSSPGLTSATSSAFQFANAAQVGPVSTVASTITSSDASLLADGVDQSTITVQMTDAGGNNLTTSQGVVTLTASTGTLSAVTDNNDGTYTAIYTAPASRGTGTATISGDLGGATMSDTATITLYTPQSITFPGLTAVPLGTLPFAVTASASSGLTVSFSLGGATTNSACTVTSAGVVTILNVGDCEVLADQSGNGVYWPATQASQTFAVQATTPTAPFISSVTPGSAQVSVAFTAPGFNGGAAISDYEFSIDDGTTWISAGVTSSPVTVSGLVNDTAYVVVIRAVNSAGAGPASEGSPSVTPTASGPYVPIPVSATVPSAPRVLSATEATATSVTVVWRVPITDGGTTITSYTVTVSPTATCTASMDATAGTGTCTASSLTPGQTYTFVVHAVNSVGAGESATVRYTVPGGGSGGGGGGTGGGSSTDPTDDIREDTQGEDSGGSRTLPIGSGPALPPRFPTPDGPSDEERRKLGELPTSKDVRGLPPSTPVPGVPPTPAPAWVPPSGLPTGSSDGSVGGGSGFRTYDPSAPEVQSLIASGTSFTQIQSAGTQGYSTTWRYSVSPNSMLQVVVPMEPATGSVPFALWLQDRKGAWTTLGTTSLVDGQLVLPVLYFDLPGVYQVVATSIDTSARVRASSDEPRWGKTTVRTIVTVKADDALGTTLCPNTVGFTADSARLDRADRRELRRLSVCLGATPRVTITGYVHGYTKPKVARELARDRALVVKKFLRSVGFTGRVVVDQSIVQRPAACKPLDNRCAVVEIRLGSLRNSMESVSAATSGDGSAASVDADPGEPSGAESAALDVEPAADGSADVLAVGPASSGPPASDGQSVPTDGVT